MIGPGTPSTIGSSEGTSTSATVNRVIRDGGVLSGFSARAFWSAFPVLAARRLSSLSGVDASVYSTAGSLSAVSLDRPNIDVQGSLLRVAFASAPESTNLVGLQYGRNIAEDLSILVDLQLIDSDGGRTNENVDALYGTTALSYYPDTLSRLVASLDVAEIDAGLSSGSLEDATSNLVDGVVSPGITEELRVRGGSLSYLAWMPGTDPGNRSSIPWVAITARYFHDGKRTIGLDSVPTADVGDIFGIGATAWRDVGPLGIRGHFDSELGNGRLGRLHAGALLGNSYKSPFRAEFGGAFTSDSATSTPVLLGRGSWRVVGDSTGLVASTISIDGRLWPGSDATKPVVLASMTWERWTSDWSVETRMHGLYRTETSQFGGSLSGTISRIRSSRTGLSSNAIEFHASLIAGTGPFIIEQGFDLFGDIGETRSRPVFSTAGSLSYRFDLFAGALDVDLGIDNRWGTQRAGLRFDPLDDLYLVDPSDTARPFTPDPLFDARATLRIGSAVFTFALRNLLDGESWTLRRYDEPGRSFWFGLNWTLID